MRTQFIASEVGIGLRRNLTLTIAVIVTTAVSLTLVGVGLLTRKEANLSKGFWYGKIEVSIFLCTPIVDSTNCGGKAVTPEQRTAILNDLNATPVVKKVSYESPEEAYKNFKEQFKDSPDLVNNVSPEALGDSFRVKLKDPTKFDVVASAFQDRPGVAEVQDIRKVTDKIIQIFDILAKGAIGVAVVSLLSAIILISNTIRVAAFNRRRETGIMRLVGASNLYIQLPFLLEGLIAGVVGVGAAAAFLAAGQSLVINSGLRPNIKFLPWIGWHEYWATVPWLLLIGVALSTLASFVTLRRYLRV